MYTHKENGNCLYPEVLHSAKDNKLNERLKILRDKFFSKFTCEPDVYIRVPGRVNLIGEHVDYCGYSVCPMAIDQDILLAAKGVNSSSDFLEVTNIEKKYSDFTVPDEDFR